MKFRRDQNYIIMNIYGTFLLLALVTSPLYKLYISDKDWMGLFIALLIHMGLFSLGCLACYSLGHFTSYITLDDSGITLTQRKKPTQHISWEQVARILFTRHQNGKTIVFFDYASNKIWMAYNKKTIAYIQNLRPELVSKFPDSKDIRRWENWEQLLPF